MKKDYNTSPDQMVRAFLMEFLVCIGLKKRSVLLNYSMTKMIVVVSVLISLLLQTGCDQSPPDDSIGLDAYHIEILGTSAFQSIMEIQPVFEKNLRHSLEKVIESTNPYGYAIVLGEDIEQSYVVWASVNTEESLKEHDQDFCETARYLVDEWMHGYYDHYDEFNKKFESLLKEFQKTHAIYRDDFYHTEAAEAFLNIIYYIYLDTMKKVLQEEAFSSIEYKVIWIPDCDRDITKQSMENLNSRAVYKKVKKVLIID